MQDEFRMQQRIFLHVIPVFIVVERTAYWKNITHEDCLNIFFFRFIFFIQTFNLVSCCWPIKTLNYKYCLLEINNINLTSLLICVQCTKVKYGNAWRDFLWAVFLSNISIKVFSRENFRKKISLHYTQYIEQQSTWAAIASITGRAYWHNFVH